MQQHQRTPSIPTILALTAISLLWAFWGQGSSAAAPLSAVPVSAQEITRLLQQLQTGPSGARNRAAQRLYHLRDPRGNRAVIALAADLSAETRALGVWAISVVRPPRFVSLLKKRLADPSSIVRLATVKALGASGPGRAIGWLHARLNDSHAVVRAAAVRALANRHDAAFPTLVRATRNRHQDVRLLAIAALAGFKHKAAVRQLRRLARKGPELSRLQAAKHLAQAAPGLSEKVLCSLALFGRNKGVRLQAIDLLGQNQGRAATQALNRLTHSHDPTLKAAATRTLKFRQTN